MRRQAFGRVRALFPLMLCACLGLVACTPPQYDPPSMRLPDRYSMMMPIRAPADADPRWWLSFRDPVLDGLIAQGLSGNLSLAEAQARLREAEALARRAKAPLTGDLRVDSNFRGQGVDSAEAGLNAGFQPPGGLRARAGAALARLQAAGQDAAETRRILLSEVALAYVDLRYAQQLLIFRQADTVSRRETLQQVTTQLEGGVATQFDRMRAETLVLQTRTEIPGLETAIVEQRNRISTLLGVPVGDLGIHLGYPGRQPQPQGRAGLGVPADLLRARPDILRAERIYAAAVSDIAETKAARYPRLTLSGLIEAPLSGGSATDVLGAGLLIPVFSQGALGAEVTAAEARADQALLQWRAAVLTAVEEVENALISLQGSRRAAAAAADLVRLNEDTLDLSRRLLASGGDSTVLDLLDRERALSDSRVTLALNLRDVARDYIVLRTALGLADGISAGPAPAP
jgi:outer membrane protein, multidrug efflux system